MVSPLTKLNAFQMLSENRVLCHTRTCSAVLVLCLSIAGVSYMDGPHQQFLTLFRKQMVWCLYWCGLGILSSVGLGTGLHTFLLYLVSISDDNQKSSN